MENKRENRQSKVKEQQWFSEIEIGFGFAFFLNPI